MSDIVHGTTSPGWMHRRELRAYPSDALRRRNVLITVAITVSLYYELYVGGGVAPLLLGQLRMPFNVFVLILAFGNLAGAFASLLAGLSDRYGRANLVLGGLLIVSALVTFAIPNATDLLTYALEYGAVAFVEGVVLVATPALIRDFSPQVGRGTAMGVWTVGPVLGSLMVSLLATLTLPALHTWQSQYEIAGIIGFIVLAIGLVSLRELSPALRDQIMVNLRDATLVETRARGLTPNLRAPFRQLLRPDVIAAAFGLSVLLMFYYTSVAFGTIYLTTIFHFSVTQANALANWNWGVLAVGLVVIGILSDRLRVRKPFMLVGGIGAVVLTWLYLAQAGHHPSWGTLVVLSCLQSAMVAMCNVTWMASFTEMVEARNPALTATGLAIWGWIQRVVVTVTFLAIPHVVSSVTPLIMAGPIMAAYQHAQATHTPPSPLLLAMLGQLKQAVALSPGQWQTWFWICLAGIVVFIATIFALDGRWSPSAARADEEAHDRAVSLEVARLSGTAGAAAE